MNCPKCGYQLSPFERNCARCARLGEAAVPATPEPGPDLPKNWCPSCRTFSLMADGICAHCGRDPREKRTPGLLMCVLLGAVLLFAVTIGFMVMQHRSAVHDALYSSTKGNAPALLSAPAVGRGQIDQRLLESSANTGGELEVSLAWNTLTDLDVEVADPSGERITASHRRSQSGGIQDVDANPTLLNEAGEARLRAGQRPLPEDVIPVPDMLVDLDSSLDPETRKKMMDGMGTDTHAPSRFTRSPVEHIYFDHAASGTYTVFVQCYSWREPTATPLPYTVQIRSKGKVVSEMSGTIGPDSYISGNAIPIAAAQYTIP